MSEPRTQSSERDPKHSPKHSMGEFDLIAAHLSALGARRDDVSLGVGDDAAIITAAGDGELRCACLCVPLVAQAQLPHAIDLAFSSLSSQLQSQHFTPAWATLALTLSRGDDELVKRIANAVHVACLAHGVAVIGGDTTAGEPSLTIFLTGVHN